MMLQIMMEIYNNSHKKALIQEADTHQVRSKINILDFFQITDHHNSNNMGLKINQIITLKILVAIINYLSPIEIYKVPATETIIMKNSQAKMIIAFMI
jgi:hypothetical protein